MRQWFNIEGERHLLEAESVEDSGDRMEQILNSFTGFLIEANVSLSPLASASALFGVSLSAHPSDSRSSPSPGPKAPCHVVGVRGRAAAAERAPLPRDRDVQGFRLHLQVGPGRLPV